MLTLKSPRKGPPAGIILTRAPGRKAVAILNCLAMLQYFLVLILTTSRDTTKLTFLTLAVLKVGIMNVGCFETN
jgi:hypothetical protein